MENKDKEIASFADFANLLDVILLKIFRYLRTDELCLAGRVCSRWLELSRDPSLWESVDLQDIQLSWKQIDKLFIILPSYTKYLRIHRLHNDDELDSQCIGSKRDPDKKNQTSIASDHRLSSNYEVPQFSLLQNRCPYLQTLIMDSIVLNHSNSIRHFELSQLPLHVKVLSVRKCQIVPLSFFPGESCSDIIIQSIKVLDLSKYRCFNDVSLHFLEPNRLPFLQELYLAGCPISDYTIMIIAAAILDLKVLDIEMTLVSGYSFRTLDELCKNLEQLFIGGSMIHDEELRDIPQGSLCNLKVICLKGTRTSWESRRTLLSSLPTLQSMNGLPRSVVFSEELLDDYSEMCDHFFLREKDLEV